MEAVGVYDVCFQVWFIPEATDEQKEKYKHSWNESWAQKEIPECCGKQMTVMGDSKASVDGVEDGEKMFYCWRCGSECYF